MFVTPAAWKESQPASLIRTIGCVPYKGTIQRLGQAQRRSPELQVLVHLIIPHRPYKMTSLSVALLCGVAVLCLAACSTATPVSSCLGNGEQSVAVEGCTEPPCHLKKGTKASVTINFTPAVASDSLVNKISAKVFGLNLPFPKVDGTDASSQIFLPDGSPASFPLSAGVEYVYKNSFPVLPQYPAISTKILWKLRNENGDTPVCFSVRAQIVN